MGQTGRASRNPINYGFSADAESQSCVGMVSPCYPDGRWFLPWIPHVDCQDPGSPDHLITRWGGPLVPPRVRRVHALCCAMSF